MLSMRVLELPLFPAQMMGSRRKQVLHRVEKLRC